MVVGELDAAADELHGSHRHLMAVLVLCAGFVERRAAEGDAEAQQLAPLIAGAFATSTCAGIRAKTAIIEEAKR
jgi:hypothetical protein